MIKRFKRTMLASVTLAATGLLAPAPAQAVGDFGCSAKVWQYCSANWQAIGYGFFGPEDCYSFFHEGHCRQYPPNPWDPNWPYLPPVP